ncbi:glycosyltransferase 87 family protein [Anaeromyxobacter paludicola]|uniref:DUF2029 domain-containing protein n=1 Tax=Anaeromyxobacter paludicola TaxID=2918171 RepID=A0ABM7X6H3_9BACT|nr:glycosyltransferase 87 family protein [Anaeromyxobacter paludicola]BDG07439.1 hypothetical protein AMPC_05520 [Anaeromyxobacter paludicola]
MLRAGARASPDSWLAPGWPRRLGLALLAGAVVAELLARGPARGLRESQDLAVHAAAARLFVDGRDPYDPRLLAEAFRRAGGPPGLTPTATWMPSVYPPVTYLVEAPLALLRWRPAVILWQAASLALALAAIRALARAAALPPARALAFALAALALAPLHTGLAMGQGAVPAAALLCLGWCERRARPVRAGLLLALGAALKPSLALPVVLAALARPAPALVASAGAAFAAASALAEARLRLAGVEGVRHWLRNVALAAGPGGMNAPFPENPYRITLLNWDVLLAQLLPEPLSRAPGAVSIALALPLVALALRRSRAAAAGPAELAPAALLCLAGLLSMYHRSYDGVLLWLPIAAVARGWRGLGPWTRRAAAAGYAAFLVPGPVVLDLLARSGRLPEALTGGPAWRLLVLPHPIWILSAAAGAFAWRLARRERAAAARPAGAA